MAATTALLDSPAVLLEYHVATRTDGAKASRLLSAQNQYSMYLNAHPHGQEECRKIRNLSVLQWVDCPEDDEPQNAYHQRNTSMDQDERFLVVVV